MAPDCLAGQWYSSQPANWGTGWIHFLWILFTSGFESPFLLHPGRTGYMHSFSTYSYQSTLYQAWPGHLLMYSNRPSESIRKLKCNFSDKLNHLFQAVNQGLASCKSIQRCWLVVFRLVTSLEGSPDGSVVKNPPANAGVAGLIPRSGRCPGKGNGNSLQYSCLKNHGQRNLVGYSPYGH